MSVDCTECGARLPSHGSLDLHKFSHATGVLAGELSGVPTPMALSEALTPQERNRQAVLGQATAVAIMAVVVFLAGIGSVFVVDGDSSSTASVAAGASRDSVGSAGASPGGASVPTGYRLVTRPAEGFTVAVPSRLEELPVSAGELAEMADLLDQSGSMSPQALLLTVDKASGDNLIIQRMAAPAGASIDKLPAGLFSEAYRELGASQVDERRVHIDAGDAVEVVTTLPIEGVAMRLTQHVMVRASSIWVMTYTEVASAPAGTAATIAETLRFAD